MSRPVLSLSLVTAAVALAACGTPQERCIDSATAETRNLQHLLAEVDGNLARGYAYQSYQDSDLQWGVCGYYTVPLRDGGYVTRPNMCMDDVPVVRTRSVPIDPLAEQRKRDALIARMKALRPQMDAEVASCRATYPQ